MIAVAVAPARVAMASSGAEWRATGQLAPMNTIAPTTHSTMLIADR